MADALLSPYTPAPNDSRWLNHLLRRTCFGVTVKAREKFAGKTPAEVVDAILNYDAAEDPFNHLVDELDGFLTPFVEAKQVQGWWIYRILRTQRPFQERIALFWHNRFATSIGKIENVNYMHNQIELFRQKGLSNYRDLLIAVGRDPAMLLWLDGATSKKGKPNENYARELMELFSLGIGHYTEKDVQEVARAFTGWTIKSAKGVLDPARQDQTEKEVFGTKANYDDEKIVDLILSKPAAAEFLAKKLLQEFVTPNPTSDMTIAVAKSLTANKWELKPTLRELFTSHLFYSDAAYRTKIKSPVELVIGSIQMMLDMGGKANIERTVRSVTAMGQAILYPPSVKGWDGEQLWINANTMLVRMNYALAVATQRGSEFTRKSDVYKFLDAKKLDSSEKIVDHFAAILLDGKLSEESRKQFLTFLNTDEKGKPKPLAITEATVNARVRVMMHMMMTMPEYQLS